MAEAAKGGSARTATELRGVPYASRTKEEMANQRITIWHKIQQRKIVGNAAPMAKNLQQYLDKHTDCEVYKGQDRPDEPKQENPMEMVLTEDGEADFYYAARNSTQPLHIPSPGAKRGDFPAPPSLDTGGGGASVGGGKDPLGAAVGMAIPGTSTGRMGGFSGSVGMATSVDGAGGAMPLAIPRPSPDSAALAGGAAGSMDVGSMGSLGAMSWGTPPGDGLGGSPGPADGSGGLPQASPPIGGAAGGMPLAMGAQQSSGGAPDMSMSGFPSASPPVGGAVGDPTPRHRSGLWGAAPSMTKADLPQQGAGEIDETHEVDMDMGDQPMEL